MKKIKISAVSYLNTKPFIYGLFKNELAESIDLQLDIPSVCARKLAAGEVDLALTPVAILPQLPEAYLVSDYCIGATGAVRTVCIFSEKPLPEVRKIYLDFHSKTSVELTKILCREHWNIHPELLPAPENFEKLIGGDTAGLVIGDRAIGLEKRFPFTYDLGEVWTAWTGLPFVFAAWVSTRPLDQEFLGKFNRALRQGLDHLPELVKILPTLPGFNLEDYFRHCISYELDEAKWAGLSLFLEKIAPGSEQILRRNFAAAPVF